MGTLLKDEQFNEFLPKFNACYKQYNDFEWKSIRAKKIISTILVKKLKKVCIIMAQEPQEVWCMT